MQLSMLTEIKTLQLFLEQVYLLNWYTLKLDATFRAFKIQNFHYGI